MSNKTKGSLVIEGDFIFRECPHCEGEGLATVYGGIGMTSELCKVCGGRGVVKILIKDVEIYKGYVMPSEKTDNSNFGQTLSGPSSLIKPVEKE